MIDVVPIDWPATFTALGTLVAAIGAVLAVILSFLNRRAATEARAKADDAAHAAERAKVAAEDSKREIIATKEGVFEVGRQIDGRLSELLRSSTALARAEGVAQGEQSQRDRAAAPEALREPDAK
jgi:hypothetical protein